MKHPEPIVTISLAEYEELKDYKKRFQKSEVSAYVEALAVFAYNSGGNVNRCIAELRAKGINTILIENRGNADYARIYVERDEKR